MGADYGMEKILLSALIIFVAIILSIIAGSFMAIVSYWILSGLLIYLLFKEKEEEY